MSNKNVFTSATKVFMHLTLFSDVWSGMPEKILQTEQIEFFCRAVKLNRITRERLGYLNGLNKTKSIARVCFQAETHGQTSWHYPVYYEDFWMILDNKLEVVLKTI